MGLIDDIMAMDGSYVVDSDLMPGVESITYTPASGSPVAINAQVFRALPQDVTGSEILSTPMLKIWIRRHVTEGRLTIDLGGDNVTVAIRMGGTPESVPVAAIESEDAGGFMLRLLR